MMRYLPLEIVKQKAISLGFNDCGAAKAEQLCSLHFDKWIKKGYNANMPLYSFRRSRLYA